MTGKHDWVFVDGTRLALAVLYAARTKTAHRRTKEELEEASKEYAEAIVEFKRNTCEANNTEWFDQ